MNIWITAPFSEKYLSMLKEYHSVRYESWEKTKKVWSGKELRDRLISDRINVFVLEVDYLAEDAFDKDQELKMICACHGTPRDVDLPTATKHGVVVTNTPDRNATAVAELTVALMIGVARNVQIGERVVRDGTWRDDVYFTLAGREITGKTVGLVGFGGIAKQVARRLLGFDVRILAYDPYISPVVTSLYQVELTTLDMLMKSSDFVSIHLPVTEETRGLVSKDYISLLKPTSYFINTARAAVVDDDAILYALRQKNIAGAAFDVFSDEPLPSDSPYLHLDNVLLTPHIGGATYETFERHSMIVYKAIQNLQNGNLPNNIVNSDVIDRTSLQ